MESTFDTIRISRTSEGGRPIAPKIATTTEYCPCAGPSVVFAHASKIVVDKFKILKILILYTRLVKHCIQFTLIILVDELFLLENFKVNPQFLSFLCRKDLSVLHLIMQLHDVYICSFHFSTALRHSFLWCNCLISALKHFANPFKNGNNFFYSYVFNGRYHVFQGICRPW